MLFASILFLLEGVLDGAYPGGPSWFTGTAADFSILSYLFAFVNTVVALFVARGSERSLVARIGLAGFFVLERPLSAFIFGEKPIASVGTHLLTAAVELIILISAVRVWRLGHSLAARDVDVLFSLEGPSPAAPPEPDAGGESALIRPRCGRGQRGSSRWSPSFSRSSSSRMARTRASSRVDASGLRPTTRAGSCTSSPR